MMAAMKTNRQHPGLNQCECRQDIKLGEYSHLLYTLETTSRSGGLVLGLTVPEKR